MLGRGKDVFLCHASADKEAIVLPLANLLDDAGISYWLDEAEIGWGDSLLGMVNEGLRTSRYVLVVLTQQFLQRNWPERELKAALNSEIGSGEVRVLPLLSGNPEERRRILAQYPLVAEKLHLTWPEDRARIVQHLQRKLANAATPLEGEKVVPVQAALEPRIPILKRPPTDRERDRFIADTFRFLRQYFSDALKRLEEMNDGVAVDFQEIHSRKFLSRVYVNEERKLECKIWVDTNISGEEIRYIDGIFDAINDNSWNDGLSLASEELS